MKKLICPCLLLLFINQISISQEIRFRTINEVVFGFYKPWDEEKLNSKIQPQLLQKDIDLYVNSIEELGVDPYVNISKESFYHEINLLKKRIDKPLTRRDFLVQIVPIVNELKLSHTFLKTDFWFDKKYYDKNGSKFFPIDIRIEGDRLYIEKNYSSSKLNEDEILSINNVHSKEIIDSLLKYSTAATSYSRLMNIQNNFSDWLWWVYNFTDTFEIKTNKAVYYISGLTTTEIRELKNKLIQQTNKEYKQYDFIQVDSATSKLTFRDFGIRDTASYRHFLDSAFFQLKNNSIQNLIIDVRGNGGGGDIYGVEIVKYLIEKPFKAYSKIYNKKSKKAEDFFLLFLYPEDRDNPEMKKAVNWFGSCETEYDYGDYYECENEIHYPKTDSIRFKGKVFVLSDYNVVSAGTVFVGLIKDYNIGKIIGTETEQSPSNDGQGCYFLLPYSNVMAMGATTYSIRPNGNPSASRGVIPDYEVKQLKKDTEKGIDTIMDFTMRLIKN